MDVPVAKTVLDNGIRVLTQKLPHSRSVSMGVWVNVGARDETESESGLSHFIEHMIFKGTRRRSAYQIAKEFDAIGGHTNAFTTMENTCYHAKVMEAHTETMVDILSDIFINSVFDPAEIDRERPVILQEIGMVMDSPDEYVHVLSGHNFWGDHPLGRSILGTPENITRFDDGMLKNFFQRLYQPDRIVISVAGKLEHNQIVDMIKPAFEAIPTGKDFPERLMPPDRSVVDFNHRDLEQMHICLGTKGLAISDPRRYTFSLLNTITGGNMSSRLFQEVRERRGLAYSVYSFIASHVDTGMFGFYLGVDPKQTRDATVLVLDEIVKLKTKRIKSSELKSAMEYTKGSLMLAAESVDNHMVRNAQNEMHFGHDITLEEIIAKIEGVTADDILELADDLINPDKMTFTLLGPVNDMGKELQELFPTGAMNENA
jgi:predicted Zn-dependent peptidase